jgi:hypothetical protein
MGDADASLFEKVMESMSYEEVVDHVLFGHIKEQMEKRGLVCNKIYSCLYYLHANGGLTAADLLKEIAADSSVEKIANSELFKTEFIEKVLPGEDENPLELDAYVFEQVQLALKQLKGKVDLEFYDSAADYLGDAKQEEPQAEPEETPENVDVEAESPANEEESA